MEHFEALDDVYHNDNIYRSLIIYTCTLEYKKLEDLLIAHDYSIAYEEEGRIYAYHVNMLLEENSEIDWDSISVIFCLGEEAFTFACNKFPNFYCKKI